jgi:hypothetical protein
MIYFLCRMFHETQVSGINFETSSLSTIASHVGKQNKYNQWKQACLLCEVDRMIEKYVKLTSIAFGVNCSSPPAFFLDEIQKLRKPTTVKSKFTDNQVVCHSYLSLLLTQLAGKHKPVYWGE